WPSGAFAVTWAAITVTLFSPHADSAYEDAAAFIVGNTLATVSAAIILFGALPAMSTFAEFGTILGLFLVPAGALMAGSGYPAMFTALAANLVPLVAPANQMTYDPAKFANTALSIVGGSGVAALSFRLLPPLSPASRPARLVALTFRDLRTLAVGPVPNTSEAWERLVYARLTALPAEAPLLQRGGMVGALSVGIAIVELRGVAAALGVGPDV